MKEGLAFRTILNSAWNLVPLVWSTLLGLIAIPIVVKMIGIEHFGIYGLFAVLLAPLSLANLGFGEATIKYVAQYAETGDFATASKFVRTTLMFNGLAGLAGSLVIWFAGPSLAFRFFNLRAGDHELVKDCLLLVSGTWLLNQLSSVFMGVPPAFHKFRIVAWATILISTSGVVLGVLLVLLGFGLYGYTAANLLSAAIGLAVWFSAAARLLPGQNLWPRFDLTVWHRAFRFGSWRALAQFGGLLASQAERFLLGVFLTPASVGFYNVALTLEQRVYSAVFRMSEVLFPVFSGMDPASHERTLSILLRATWLLTSIAVCALVPLVALGRPLLSAWISPEAGRQAGLVLQFLALAGVLGCATNASNYFLLGSGRTKWSAVLSLTTGVTTVCLSALLLPRYGLRAAALPAVAAMVAQQVVLATVVLRGIFRHELALSKLLIAFYGPVCIGLGVAVPMAQFDFFAGRSLAALVPLYALISVLLGITIPLVHRFLPGGFTHWQDARYALFLLRRPLFAARQATCAA